MFCEGPISTAPRTACPLQGLLASELICLTCQHTVSQLERSKVAVNCAWLLQSPIKYEVFDSLSLNLPLNLPQVT